MKVESCIGRYGDRVIWKSTTKSTIQFDPPLIEIFHGRREFPGYVVDVDSGHV